MSRWSKSEWHKRKCKFISLKLEFRKQQTIKTLIDDEKWYCTFRSPLRRVKVIYEKVLRVTSLVPTLESSGSIRKWWKSPQWREKSVLRTRVYRRSPPKSPLDIRHNYGVCTLITIYFLHPNKFSLLFKPFLVSAQQTFLSNMWFSGSFGWNFNFSSKQGVLDARRFSSTLQKVITKFELANYVWKQRKPDHS